MRESGFHSANAPLQPHTRKALRLTFSGSGNAALHIPTVTAASTSCIPRPTVYSATHLRRGSNDPQYIETFIYVGKAATEEERGSTLAFPP